MPPLDVNWLAVLIAAAAYFGIGALWYGPLFGQKWAAAMGLNPDDMMAAKQNYAITFVAILVLASLLAGHVKGAADMVAALLTAFWLWLGFVATTGTINSVWDSRGWSVFGINQGYHLVGMLVSALILSLWK